ncbi:MAG: hypothetical protein ACYSVY_17750, partial [Planctomycetota bacterium]
EARARAPPAGATLPTRHRTLAYGHYANRVRGERAAKEPGTQAPQDKPAKKRRGGASWARLISKVFDRHPECAQYSPRG